MGPMCKRRTTRSSPVRKSRRTIQKKQPAAVHKSKIAESPTALQPCAATPTKVSNSTTTSTTIDHGVDFGAVEMDGQDCSPCTTPKSEKYRIPEIKTCPPAPKKRRVLNFSSVRRRPIAFFSPPDVELFFFVALRDIPA